MGFRYHHDEQNPALKPNEIFVFGSNWAGIHGAGAALAARNYYGAEIGLGRGLQGKSYAIPTKNSMLVTMSLFEIEESVRNFIYFAQSAPEWDFYVTRIGCGLSGYQDSEIAPLFSDSPSNCIMPLQWRVYLDRFQLKG